MNRFSRVNDPRSLESHGLLVLEGSCQTGKKEKFTKQKPEKTVVGEFHRECFHNRSCYSTQRVKRGRCHHNTRVGVGSRSFDLTSLLAGRTSSNRSRQSRRRLDPTFPRYIRNRRWNHSYRAWRDDRQTIAIGDSFHRSCLNSTSRGIRRWML